MALNRYDVNDLVRITAAFKNAGGTLTDPSGTITMKYQDPSGNETTDTYIGGTTTAIVKEATGTYHYDISVDEAGVWYYRFQAAGTGQAADEQMFIVDATVF